MMFLRTKERHSSFINSLAKSVLSVYIVHQVPAFISFIWSRIFRADLWIPNHAAWYVFAVFIVILAVCSTVDLLRRKTVEPIAGKTSIYKKSVTFINRLYDFDRKQNVLY